MSELIFKMACVLKPRLTTLNFTFSEQAFTSKVNFLNFTMKGNRTIYAGLDEISPVGVSGSFFVPSSVLLRIDYATVYAKGREFVLIFNNGHQPTCFEKIFSFRT